MNKLLAAVTSVCFLIAVPAQAGIANTKHNLSSLSTQANHVTGTGATGTDEICVFCHTPHAADTSAPVPLWNKKLPAGTGYTTYATLNSSTIDGKILNVGSISLACLSCHDGTQAMDNIINAPGSGGYDVTGGGVNGLGYTWTAGATVDVNGKMINTATTLAMLSTDLSNDHPIGIAYCGGGPNAGAPTGACVDKDFVAPKNAVINGNQVWWVDTAGGGVGTRDKSDMILYTRDFGTAGNPLAVPPVPAVVAMGPSVECGSCHDPHVESGTGTPVSGQTFLRISNSASAVCLSCHVK